MTLTTSNSRGAGGSQRHRETGRRGAADSDTLGSLGSEGGSAHSAAGTLLLVVVRTRGAAQPSAFSALLRLQGVLAVVAVTCIPTGRRALRWDWDWTRLRTENSQLPGPGAGFGNASDFTLDSLREKVE